MINIIKHRINTINDLKNLSPEWGIEIDVRYHENEIVLHHDPYNHHLFGCERLESLLKVWTNQGTIILNLKSEGLEKDCIKLMAKYKIKNWFFLDMSMPYFVKFSDYAKNRELSNFSPENLAVRFSDKEPIDYALAFSKKARWVWVDHFDKFPLNQQTYSKLLRAEFNICLVSPELQTQSNIKIDEIKSKCQGLNIQAVCTKLPEIWN